MADFLWGEVESRTKHHWIKWRDLCYPTEEGGVGIRTLGDAFTAFSVKLWWRFRTSHSLWAQFMQSKYCSNIHPSQVRAQATSSLTWKRMLLVRDITESQMRWLVNKGNSHFYFDNWTREGPLAALGAQTQNSSIQDFMLHSDWNVSLIRQHVPPGLATKILEFSPPMSDLSDQCVWSCVHSGKFTLSSAFKLIRQSRNPSAILKKLWHSVLPVKISFFMLCLIRRRLPMDDIISQLGIQGPSRCHCCLAHQQETIDHVFCLSELATRTWRYFSVNLLVSCNQPQVWSLLSTWWLHVPKQAPIAFVRQILPSVICWHLWKWRNLARFQGRQLEFSTLVTNIRQDMQNMFNIQFKSARCNAQSWPIFIDTISSMQQPHFLKWVKWRSPPRSKYKLNTDGCSKGNPGQSEGGGILRDSMGRMIFAFSCYFGEITSVQAEAKSLLWGIRHCQQLQIPLSQIECDNQLIIHVLQQKATCPWTIAREVQEILKCLTSSTSLNHCFREANKVADELANHGCLSRTNSIFHDELSLPRMARGELRIHRLGFPSLRKCKSPTDVIRGPIGPAM